MAWTDNVGRLAKNVGDYTGINGLIKDVATAASDDDPFYVDALQIAGDTLKIATTPIRGAFTGLLAVGEKSYEIGGKAREGIVRMQISSEKAYNKFKNPGESYGEYLQRIKGQEEQISLAQSTASVFLGQGKYGNSNFLNDWEENNALFLAQGFDLFDEKQRDIAFNQQRLGKFSTGTVDLTASLLIDPLTLLGPVAKIGRIATLQPYVNTVLNERAFTPVGKLLNKHLYSKFAMTDDKMKAILESATEGNVAKDLEFFKDANEGVLLEYFSKNKFNNPELLAHVLGKANTTEDVVDTMKAVVFRDKTVAAKLIAKDAENALILDGLEPVSHPERLKLSGGLDIDVIPTESYNTAVAAMVERTVGPGGQGQSLYEAALNKVISGESPFRRQTLVRGLVGERKITKAVKRAEGIYGTQYLGSVAHYIKPTSAHPLMMIVDYAKGKADFFTREKPQGLINHNDVDAFNEVRAYIREVNALTKGALITDNSGAQFMTDYLRASDPTAKEVVFKALEQKALGLLAPNYTADEIAKIYRALDTTRSRRISELKNRGFLSIMEDGGPIVLKYPLLERQAVNMVPMMDIKRLSKALNNHERILPGVLAGLDIEEIGSYSSRFLNVAQQFNDVFKTSVLLRLGYTFRNLTEAGFSMMGKGIALTGLAVANAPGAAQRFVNNRVMDARQLVDSIAVAQGRRVSTEVLSSLLTKHTDELAAIENSVELLASPLVRSLKNILEEGTPKNINEIVKGQTWNQYNTYDEALKEYNAAVKNGDQVAIQRNRELLDRINEEASRQMAFDVENVMSALQELRHDLVYHGSPAGEIKKLDKAKRYIATSLSESAAKNYTNRAEQIFSIEKKLGRKPMALGTVTKVEDGVRVRDMERISRAANELKKDIRQAVNSGLTVSYRTGPARIPADVAIDIDDFADLGLREVSGEEFYKAVNRPEVLERFATPPKPAIERPFTRKTLTEAGRPQELGTIPFGLKAKEFLSDYTAGEYDTFKTFLSEDGLSGFAIKTDGDIISVFNIAEEKGRGSKLLKKAVSEGGTKLDFFDGKLRDIYTENGFVVTKREANWTPGREDVVYAEYVARPRVQNLGANTTAKWKTVDLDELDAFTPEQMERMVFKGTKGKPAVTPLKVYGNKLDLTVSWKRIPQELKETMGWKTFKDFRDWRANRSWQTDEKIFDYAASKGVGKILIKDKPGRSSGHSLLAVREFTGPEGLKNWSKGFARGQFDDEVNALSLQKPDVVAKEFTVKEAKELRQQVKKQQKFMPRARKDYAVDPMYDLNQISEMFQSRGFDDVVKTMAGTKAQKLSEMDSLLEAFGARSNFEKQLRTRQKLGYGMNEWVGPNGMTYRIPKVFEGASWFRKQVSADSTWSNLASSQQMAFMAGDGAYVAKIISPNDPRYFDSWQRTINFHFRDPETGRLDPVVERIFKGETDEQIARYLLTDKEGQQWAAHVFPSEDGSVVNAKLPDFFPGGQIKVNARTVDAEEFVIEKIQQLRNATELYIPTPEMRERLLDLVDAVRVGDIERQAALNIDELYLRENFGKGQSLPTINALVIPTSREARNQERIIDRFNKQVFRWLGSLPEDTFSRFPLAQDLYDKRMKQEIARRIELGETDISLAEMNALANNVRNNVRVEVERTLFTIKRRTGASQSLSMIFPFYAAWENTLKRWGGIAAESPEAIAKASRAIAIGLNSMDVRDAQGNPVDKIDADSYLLFKTPEWFIKALPKEWENVAQTAFTSVRIPLRSLDIIFQGEPLNPGFGPYVAFPANQILKRQPRLEEILRPIFPVGVPQSDASIFLPAAARRLASLGNQDEQYVRTFNQILRYELYKYNQGLREEQPGVQEIEEMTKQYYILRTLTSLISPAAITPQSDYDFYIQQLRSLREEYGIKEADAKFLQMYPDFAEATLSLSTNPASVEPSYGVVDNLKKYKGLMADAAAAGETNLIGWLADDGDGKYDFSQAAYQWQYKNGPFPGEADTYRTNRNPETLARDANIKRGWLSYRQIQDEMKAYMIQNGIPSETDPRMKQFKDAKSVWLQAMYESNPDWYAEYISPDRGKYIRREQVLLNAFNDEQWMAQNGNRPVVRAAAQYLDMRSQVREFLLARKEAGGSKSLDADANSDVKLAFDAFVTQLETESPEFSDFVNRYFPNDPVVI